MNALPQVRDATQADFVDTVIERSRDVPVLVDFWAEWCSPCRMLTPILTKVISDYAGRVELAKVNTDQNQELALGLGVRSLPTVKLFKNGEIVDEFIGVIPENMVRDFVDRHVARAENPLLARAAGLRAQGNAEAACTALTEAEAADPDNDDIRFALAELEIELGDHEAAGATLERVSGKGRGDPRYAQLDGQLAFAAIAATAPDIEQLEHTLASDPDDCDTRLKLSARLAQRGRFEPAMEQLLEIVRRDRRFGDDAGRKTLVKLFDIVNDPALVSRYRGLLARALN